MSSSYMPDPFPVAQGCQGTPDHFPRVWAAPLRQALWIALSQVIPDQSEKRFVNQDQGAGARLRMDAGVPEIPS